MKNWRRHLRETIHDPVLGTRIRNQRRARVTLPYPSNVCCIPFLVLQDNFSALVLVGTDWLCLCAN